MPPIDMDEIRQKLQELLTKIETKIEQIRQKINSILSHVPGFLDWAVEKFLGAWNTMLGKLSEFWDWFTDKLAYVGDPFELWSTGNEWHAKVGEPGTRLANQIDDEHELLVDDTWVGTAADTYEGVAKLQEGSLRTLGQKFASAASSNLKTLAGAIGLFWAGIIAALVALVSAIIAASAATGTIIGLPAVPVLIGAGLLAFLTAAGMGVGTLKVGTVLAAEGLQNATRYADEWPKFAV